MRNACFTINNWTSADIARLEYLKDQPICSYLIYGKEVGENKGTPHLQGYVEFTNDVKMKKLKFYFPRAHLERRLGTAKEAADYCKKDGDFTEYGEPSNQGLRSDIIGLRQAIESGMSLHTVITEFPELYLKYHSAIEKWIGHASFARGITDVQQEFTDISWYSWQKDILSILAAKPHPRHIHWIYDKSGGHGKTTLTRYLISHKNAFLFSGGAKADSFFAYQNQPIVVFDLPRDFQGREYIYDTMESFKNGQFMSTKYNSMMKIFPKPHVLVFTNFQPDVSKLTEDMWNVYTIVGKVLCEKPYSQLVNPDNW